MNKAQLVNVIATEAEISKASAERALQAFTKAVGDELAQDNDVAIVGFGTFSVTHRAEREGRNPQTGEAITIKASKQPKFKAGKTLKEAVV